MSYEIQSFYGAVLLQRDDPADVSNCGSEPIRRSTTRHCSRPPRPKQWRRCANSATPSAAGTF